jgi:TRAP-type C4-dicarboxylate transport system permease small subunit
MSNSDSVRIAGRTPLRFAVEYFEELIAGAALIVVVASVCWGVLTRYVTAQPAAWAGELAVIGFAWIVFFGAAACFKYKLHPSIDMMTVLFSARVRQAVRILVHVLVLSFCAYMVWFGVRFSIDAWDNPSPVLRWPLTVLYGPVTAGFALMIVRYIQQLWTGPRQTSVHVS